MGFNAKDHDTSDNFTPMPAGEYTVALVKAERKKSQANPDNAYLNCQFTIVKGEFKKRVIFAIMNLKNANSTAMEIAQKELASLMNAVGVATLKDMWDVTTLLNKSFTASITIKKDSDYGDKNIIKKYHALEGSDNSASDLPKKKKGKKGKKKKNKDVPF